MSKELKRIIVSQQDEIARLQGINYNYAKRELSFDRSERKNRAFDGVLQRKDEKIQELEGELASLKASIGPSSLRKARLLQQKDAEIIELQAKIGELQSKMITLLEGEEK